MKRVSCLLAQLIIAMLLAACGAGSTPPGHTQESNLLVASSGTVRLKRAGWKNFVPVAAGARLDPTDLLDVPGSTTVLCASLVVKTMTATDLSKPPCPQERGLFTYDGARFGSSQRGAPKDIPYIVYPRKTLVLDAHPLLTWHATTAAHYDVAIVDSSGNVVWHQANVSGSSIRYPDSAPALQPGIDYLLVVKDDSGKSSGDDPAKGLGFRVLSAASRPAVEQQRAAIQALTSLDAAAQKLALAVYYATWPEEDGRSLWGEAALLLEQVAQTQDTPQIQLWLGDMRRATSLPNEAVSAYQKALQQAGVSGDSASQAAAHAGVWRVTGEPAQLDAAIKLYQDLGDQREVDALREESKP